MANYFLLTDDIWLSDYFFEKCLSTAQDRLSESDPELLADAHCNLGLAYERLSKLFITMLLINFYNIGGIY